MIAVTICVGSACHLKGSQGVIEIFTQEVQRLGLTDQVELQASFCMGHCLDGVCVRVGDKTLRQVNQANAKEVFEKEVVPLV